MLQRLLFHLDPKWRLLSVTSDYDYTGAPVCYQVFYSERCPEEIKVLKTHKGMDYPATFRDPDDPKVLMLQKEFRDLPRS